MWTAENRARYERRGLRYPTDLTDGEWAKWGGRPRTVNMREVMNAALYLLGAFCQWRALPKDYSPRKSVLPSESQLILATQALSERTLRPKVSTRII
jgi:transposase